MNDYPSTQLRPAPLAQKVIEMTLVFLAFLNVFSLVGELIPNLLPPEYKNEILIATVTIAVIAGIISGSLWHRKERQHKVDSNKRIARNRGILRYWLAFMISSYGFAKILKTQFGLSHYVQDSPVSALSGFELTWNYFAYSYPLSFIVALIQIGGSVMLLFRRTTLAGALFLLPVMVNIVLINLFYNISGGALFNSVIFTVTLLYLVMLRWPDIRPIVFSTHEYPQVRPLWLKNSARFLLILLPFLMIFFLKEYFVPNTQALSGKWKVDKLIKNNTEVDLDGWIKDSTVWRTVYLEGDGYANFCPNPYVYDNRSTWMAYEYEPVKKNLRLVSYDQETKQKDTMTVDIKNATPTAMQWNFVYCTDSIAMHIQKVASKK